MPVAGRIFRERDEIPFLLVPLPDNCRPGDDGGKAEGAIHLPGQSADRVLRPSDPLHIATNRLTSGLKPHSIQFRTEDGRLKTASEGEGSVVD